eukprot:936754-Rhodomonas_salina.5
MRLHTPSFNSRSSSAHPTPEWPTRHRHCTPTPKCQYRHCTPSIDDSTASINSSTASINGSAHLSAVTESVAAAPVRTLRHPPALPCPRHTLPQLRCVYICAQHVCTARVHSTCA